MIRRMLPLFPLVLAWSATAGSQTILVTPKQVRTPAFVRRLVKGRIDATVSVDFDGNGKPDFIVTVTHPSQKVERKRTRRVWINDARQVVKTTPVFDATDLFWFLQERPGTVPLIVSAFGYEDGIDYSVVRQNLHGGPDRVLFLFDPIIREEHKLYWGYPWDWSDLIGKRDGNGISVLCTFHHQLPHEDDGDNRGMPKTQKSIPVLFFTGHSTQPNVADSVRGQVGSSHWCDMEDIELRSRR